MGSRNTNMFAKIVALCLFLAISSATATPAVTVSFMGNGSSSLMPQVAASCHFEDPFQPAGCQTGELNITVQGVTGSFCAPKCDASGACPTDTCAGTVAKPQCVLQDGSLLLRRAHGLSIHPRHRTLHLLLIDLQS